VRQHRHLTSLHDSGEYGVGDLADLFAISRAMVYRTVIRVHQGSTSPLPGAPTSVPTSPTATTPVAVTAAAAREATPSTAVDTVGEGAQPTIRT
jgi:hypothetical protein